jgi:hypothetical protein
MGNLINTTYDQGESLSMRVIDTVTWIPQLGVEKVKDLANWLWK